MLCNWGAIETGSSRQLHRDYFRQSESHYRRLRWYGPLLGCESVPDASQDTGLRATHNRWFFDILRAIFDARPVLTRWNKTVDRDVQGNVTIYGLDGLSIGSSLKHAEYVTAASFSADGQRIAVGSRMARYRSGT